MANFKIKIDTFEFIKTPESTTPFDMVTDLDIFMTYRHGRFGEMENREKPFPLVVFETDELREAENKMSWNALHYPMTTQCCDGRFFFLRGRLCWLEDEDGDLLDYCAAPHV